MKIEKMVVGVELFNNIEGGVSKLLWLLNMVDDGR